VNATFRDFTGDDAVRVAAASLSRAAGEPIAIEDINVRGDEQRRNHAIRADVECHREYADAVVVSLFASLEWHLGSALKGDSTWGIATNRNRIPWHLQAAIEATQRSASLPGLRRVLQAWLTNLENRWPDVQPLAVFPAFATSREG